MEKLIKVPLNFDITLKYFKDHLKPGNLLSQIVLQKIDFKMGCFYTILPPRAKLDRLYELKYGGITSYDDFADISNEDENYLTTFSKSYLSLDDKRTILVEDVILSPSDPNLEIPGAVLFCHNDEVYYVLSHASSLSSIQAVLESTGDVWHYLAVFTKSKFAEDLFENKCIGKICDNVEFIVTNAYDGEAYIFWEKRA